MARGTSLVKLLDMLRVRAKLSLNPAHNSDDRAYQVMLLQMEQERLWDEFDWPHLYKEWTLPLQTGQRYYDIPDGLSPDKIRFMQIFWGGTWVPLCHGIGSAEYTIHKSDLDERSWPARAWRLYLDREIEIWPIPDQNADATTQEGYLKFCGYRDLNALVDDTDDADLDDQIIVGFVAAEMLAAKGDKSANLVLQRTNGRYATLRGNLVKEKSFSMLPGKTKQRPHKVVIGSYKATT